MINFTKIKCNPTKFSLFVYLILDNLLKYFKSFEVYLPNEQSPTNSKLAPTEVFKNRMTSNSTFPEVEEMFKASPRKPKDGN